MSVQKPQGHSAAVNDRRSTTAAKTGEDFEAAATKAKLNGFTETSYGDATPSSLKGSPATEQRFAVNLWRNPADLLKRDTV